VELKEEAQKRAFALLLGQGVVTKLLPPVIDFEEVKALLLIAVQQINDFFRGEMMPVLADQIVHDFLPLFSDWNSVSRLFPDPAGFKRREIKTH